MSEEARRNPLEELNTQPEEAMQELIGRYTPLVCSVAGRYLQNAEDVKDIVSETFAEVYTSRENYDPAQSSLSTWIGIIARNKAVSLYRKNRDLLTYDGEIEGVSGAAPDFTEHLDTASLLESAIGQLSETDQQILRMRYYGDMSLSEIAQTLQIPYETVKKRHTRSVARLRRILPLMLVLILVLAMALAACGYIMHALRSLGLVPGIGVTENADSSYYTLETPVSYDSDDYTVEITKAAMFDNRLTLHYRLTVDPSLVELTDEQLANGERPSITCGEMPMLTENEVLDYQVSSSETVPGGPYTVEWHLTWELTDASAAAIRGDAVELSLLVEYVECDEQELPDAFIPFTMIPASPDAIGDYSTIYDETFGGMLLDPRLSGDTLTLDLYPLSNGTTEIWGDPLQDFYDNNTEPTITIVDAEGHQYTGTCGEQYPMWHYTYTTWTFEDVAPGTYTLELPYVYLICYGEDIGELEWNLEDNTYKKREVSIPGGTMRTTYVHRLDEPDPGCAATWEIGMHFEMDDPEMTVTSTSRMVQTEWYLGVKVRNYLGVLIGYNEGTSASIGATPGTLDPDTGDLILRYSIDNLDHMQTDNYTHLEYAPGAYDVNPICIRYDHPIEMEFTVD